MQAIGTGPVFFLLVTEKLYFSPMDHAVFGSPSQTVTVLRCMKMMIFTLGLNVHSSACKFNDFVMNNPDNCSFNHFFFSSILLPSALLSLSTFRGGLDFFGPKMALALDHSMIILSSVSFRANVSVSPSPNS